MPPKRLVITPHGPNHDPFYAHPGDTIVIQGAGPHNDRWEVELGNGSPFEQGKAHFQAPGDGADSGNVDAPTQPGDYKYTIKWYHGVGKEEESTIIDPIIAIRSGGNGDDFIKEVKELAAEARNLAERLADLADQASQFFGEDDVWEQSAESDPADGSGGDSAPTS